MLFGNNMSWLYGKLKKKLDAPAVAGSAGDVLTLGESGKPEWEEAGSGLPEVTSTDEGKVLTVVDNDGTYEWEAAEPAGGGGDLFLSITGFIKKESDPDVQTETYYYYNTGVSSDELSAAYTSGSFMPVYVCIPAYGEIGLVAGAPNYYNYVDDHARIISWPYITYEHDLDPDYLYLEVIDDEIVIVYDEQGNI